MWAAFPHLQSAHRPTPPTGSFGPSSALAPGGVGTLTISSNSTTCSGHDAGDRALRAFARVLSDALRPSDIASRYGGEEFVVMLPACTIKEAIPILERVKEQMALRLESGHLPSFTVSFGVSSSDQAPDFEQGVPLCRP
jgi:hypothetical protein